MERLYFRQLRAGVDFARTLPQAASMQNFVYLVGDREKGEALVIDPAWAVGEILDLLERDGMRLTGVLATHYHPDHIGGSLFGMQVQGLAELLGRAPCPIHVHHLELPGVQKVTGLSKNDLTGHESGDRVAAGAVEIELLHTPGHTPGSLCFRLGERLISGDTLFLRGCGRVDLPGGDVDEMFRTLNDRLGALPPNTIVYPGHNYGGASAPISELKQSNVYLQIRDLQTWRRMLGR
jgi:glyoxylase-like metal-dependent hydrolase (beta-lactamase superfamily II)